VTYIISIAKKGPNFLPVNRGVHQLSSKCLDHQFA